MPATPDVFRGSGRWPEQLSGLGLPGDLFHKRQQPAGGTHWVSKIQTLLNHALDFHSLNLKGLQVIGGHRNREWPLPPSLKDAAKTTHLMGYFICPTSALKLRDELITSFLLEPPVQSQLLLDRARSSFGIHVRLGDNLIQDRNLENSLVSFYSRALGAIDGLSSESDFLVFSDNPALALRILELSGWPNRLVAAPPNLSPGNTLKLMAMTDGLLASASTFAWWGAFLNKNQDRIFFRATDKSFAANFNPGIYLQDWTLV